MDDRYIAAIDIGTSKIAIGIAHVEADNMQVIYFREHPSEGVRDGAILNPAKVSAKIGNAIHLAEEELGMHIAQAVVGMPRYKIRQENAEISMTRNEGGCVMAEEVHNLRKIVLDENIPEDSREVLLEAVAQSFSAGENINYTENEIIGMSGDTLEGNFRLFIGRDAALRNIDIAFNSINVAVARKYFTPLLTARPILRNSEIENGVALVEFGAGVTSVSVYHGGVMRYYASIPFGGKTITQDIRSEASISESLAENIKLAYGVCMPDRLESLSEKILLIQSSSADADKQLSLKYLSEIITCRQEEIIDAILYEIQRSGFADMLKNGVVITGGAANLVNCGNLLKERSGYNVRMGYPQQNFTTAGYDAILSTSAAALLGLLIEARSDESLNCCLPQEEETSTVQENPVVEDDGQSILIGFEPTDDQRIEMEKAEQQRKKKEENKEKRQKNKKIPIDLNNIGGKVKDSVNWLYDVFGNIGDDRA